MLLLFSCRMYNMCCSTYESASLRMFKYGRTDVIRSTTLESSKFVQAMEDPAKQVEEHNVNLSTWMCRPESHTRVPQQSHTSVPRPLLLSTENRECCFVAPSSSGPPADDKRCKDACHQYPHFGLNLALSLSLFFFMLCIILIRQSTGKP